MKRKVTRYLNIIVSPSCKELVFLYQDEEDARANVFGDNLFCEVAKPIEIEFDDGVKEPLKYEKAKFPTLQNCTLCCEYKNIPDGDENEGDYCFEGVDQLKHADLLDSDTIHTHSCNLFVPSVEGQHEIDMEKAEIIVCKEWVEK